MHDYGLFNCAVVTCFLSQLLLYWSILEFGQNFGVWREFGLHVYWFTCIWVHRDDGWNNGRLGENTTVSSIDLESHRGYTKGPQVYFTRRCEDAEYSRDVEQFHYV